MADLRILGLVLFIVGLAGLSVMFGNADNVTLVVAVLAAFSGGAPLGWFCLMAADVEIGVRGHFAWYPGPSGHKVTIEVEKPRPVRDLHDKPAG